MSSRWRAYCDPPVIRSVAKVRDTPYFTSAQLTNRPSWQGASLTREKTHILPPSCATPVVVERSPTSPGRKPLPDGAWAVSVRTKVRTEKADSMSVPIRWGSQASTRESKRTWRVPPRSVGIPVASACLVVQAPSSAQPTTRVAASPRRAARAVTGSCSRGGLGLQRGSRPGGGSRPFRLVENHLADPDRLGGDLDALVLPAELHGLLQAERAGRDYLLEVVRGGRPHVGQLLLLGDVDVHVVGARVLADDHALVDLGGRLDEEHAALLQRRHRVRRRRTGAVGDQRAVVARADLAGPREVALGDVVGDAGAAGLGEEVGAEADEAAGRDDELHPDPAGAVVGHALHAALADGEQLGDRAEVLLRGVDREALERLVDLAVDLAGDDLRLADGELEALAAHLLAEDRQRQLAAGLAIAGVGTLGERSA